MKRLLLLCIAMVLITGSLMSAGVFFGVKKMQKTEILELPEIESMDDLKKALGDGGDSSELFNPRIKVKNNSFDEVAYIDHEGNIEGLGNLTFTNANAGYGFFQWLGIGTTEPTHELNVIGDLNVTGTSYLGDIVLKSENITGENINALDQNISFVNSTGSSKLIINPTGTIELNDGTKMTAGWTRSLSFRDNYPVLVFDGVTGSGGFGYDSTTAMRWWVNASQNNDVSATTAAMNLDINGDLGVGTLTPDARLTVNAIKSADGLLIELNGNDKIKANADGTLYWGGNAAYGRLSWNTGHATVLGLAGYDLSFGSNNVEDQMYIKSGGNVGIGTDNPTDALNIVGSQNTTNNATFYDSLKIFKDSDGAMVIRSLA